MRNFPSFGESTFKSSTIDYLFKKLSVVQIGKIVDPTQFKPRSTLF